MIPMSRKDQLNAVKWSQKRSPLACLVFNMNGKWGTARDNDENVVSNFLKYWKPAKGAAILQGRKRLEDLSVFVPPPLRESVVRTELITLLMTMPARFERAGRYAEMESFCRDMSTLFLWDAKMDATWQGYRIAALDGEEKYEECDRLYQSCAPSEELASMYAERLIRRLDTERAKEVLEPYRDSGNPDIEKQFSMLEKIRAARSR